MYFIVFFLQIKQHRIIPYKWIRDINYESIINDGLNRNKQFYAFWTNDENAFDEHGVPKICYVPNWNARLDALGLASGLASGLVFPNEGWYLCQIRKFKGISYYLFFQLNVG